MEHRARLEHASAVYKTAALPDELTMLIKMAPRDGHAPSPLSLTGTHNTVLLPRNKNSAQIAPVSTVSYNTIRLKFRTAALTTVLHPFIKRIVGTRKAIGHGN